MGGANIELAAVGMNDNEIMGNPEITFFKSIFKRHTNFSIESKNLNHVNGDTSTFNNGGNATFVFNIPKYHHLLTNVYLEVGVSGKGENNRYSVNHFGNSLIKEAKIVIGGKQIETLDAQWLQIYHELNAPHTQNVPEYSTSSKSSSTEGGKTSTFYYVSDNTKVRTPLTQPNRVNGNVPLVFGGSNFDGDTADSTTYYKKIFIPLPFFFTKNIGLALPLCALYDEDIEITITLPQKSELIGSLIELNLEKFELYGDFVLLEKVEENRFKQSALTYLIETVQKLQLTTPSTDESSNSVETTEKPFSLNSFRLSVKYICWVVINASNDNGKGPCYFVSLCDNNENGNDGYYGKGSIHLEGETKQETRCMSYFTRYLPQKYCKYNIPELDRIGIYSFAVAPFDHQPSGTCNFSRLKDADITLKFANNKRSLIQNKPIHFYAVNYNIYNVNGGISGLKYS